MKKEQTIEELLDKMAMHIFGKQRSKAIERSGCVACDNPDLNFRDETSKKEYQLSGLCQKCQDAYFEEPVANLGNK